MRERKPLKNNSELMIYRILIVCGLLAAVAAFSMSGRYHTRAAQTEARLKETRDELKIARSHEREAGEQLRTFISAEGDLTEQEVISLQDKVNIREDELRKATELLEQTVADTNEKREELRAGIAELQKEVRELESRVAQKQQAEQAPSYGNSNSGYVQAAPTPHYDLDPMIARMAALRCREAESRLYQTRLLTLLPLIRNGAHVDITLPETKGNTALHYSCAIGSWSITEWLVLHGANVNALTDKGKTPLDCVGSDNAQRIRSLLISRGAKRSSELSYGDRATYASDTSDGADADQLNNLGLAYQYGNNGMPQNYNEAARHFRLAAERGHAGAQNNLGFCYHNGWGVPKDMVQAAVWYRRSADQGNAWGQSNYGTCLEFGWGVSKNVPAAIDMYRRAAAQGHASAKKHLKRLGL